MKILISSRSERPISFIVYAEDKFAFYYSQKVFMISKRGDNPTKFIEYLTEVTLFLFIRTVELKFLIRQTFGLRNLHVLLVFLCEGPGR